MESLSVGRLARGLLVTWFALVIGAYAEGAPDSVLSNLTQSSRPCHSNELKAFPTVDLDCAHQLEYVGSYSPEGHFDALSPYRSWYNQDAKRPSAFQINGKPLARPVEVPDFVNLGAQERVVENY